MIQNLLLRLAGMSMQRALIFAVVAAGFFYVSMYDDGGAIDSRRTLVEKQIQEEQKKSKESEVALKELEQYRGAVGALNAQFKIAAQQLPSEISASEILKSIDTISKSTGVSIKSKEPKASKREDILELLPLRVTVHGSYSEITMFLYYLSSMERITRVVNFAFTQPNSTDLAKMKHGTLVFDGEIVSYKYIASAPPDAAVKKK